MRLLNNTNASLILAIFQQLRLKNERVSATTENAPIYNVIQQQIQMTPKNFPSTKSAPQMMEGNQQSNNSNTDCNYEEAIQCQLNRIFLQKCAAKTIVQKVLGAAEISSNNWFAMMANLSSHVKSSKNHPYATNHNVNLQFSVHLLHMSISSIPLFISLSFLSLCCFFFF